MMRRPRLQSAAEARSEGCRRLTFSVASRWLFRAKLPTCQTGDCYIILNHMNYLVPAEGIEPPTFGLQNRCSTAELSRPRLEAGRAGMCRGCLPVRAAISDLVRKCQNQTVGFRRHETGGPQGRLKPPSTRWKKALLADVLEAVRSLVPGPGPANDAVAGRIGIPIAVPAHFAAAAGIPTGSVIGVGIVPAAERR